eukprot:TRINITY_DN3927_c2_g1_i1.p2 TRINITY_DN3927_c2_g1~~TRINITY_DN3927_c2_g1_i1.p2  ORF type:complete len:505 (+),score=131.37 TRINITY_DN3927_c2_g1_i1:99-1613(+)
MQPRGAGHLAAAARTCTAAAAVVAAFALVTALLPHQQQHLPQPQQQQEGASFAPASAAAVNTAPAAAAGDRAAASAPPPPPALQAPFPPLLRPPAVGVGGAGQQTLRQRALALAAERRVPSAVSLLELIPHVRKHFDAWSSGGDRSAAACGPDWYGDARPGPDGGLEPVSVHSAPIVCGSHTCEVHFSRSSGSKTGKSMQIPCVELKRLNSIRKDKAAYKKLQLDVMKSLKRGNLDAYRQCQLHPQWRTPGVREAYARLRLLCCRTAAAQKPQEVRAAPRRVFIDFGARSPPPPGADDFDWFAPVREFAEVVPSATKPPVSSLPRYPADFDEVHAFEIDASYRPAWERRRAERASEPRPAAVHFHNAAASVKAGHVLIRNSTAMFAIVGKEACAQQACVRVPSVDSAAWLRAQLKPEDWVVLKVDVEGFEYELLGHLHAAGVLQHLVDELFVELHDQQMHSHLQAQSAVLFTVKDRQWRCPNATCNAAYLLALREAGVAAHDWV